MSGKTRLGCSWHERLDRAVQKWIRISLLI
jgi:hypothetical protein